MIKVEAIVREENYEDVKAALNQIDVYGITVSQVMGCGLQKGYVDLVSSGTEVDVNMLPKIKFEVVVPNKEWADKTADVIKEAAFSGSQGDGKIFMCEIMDAIRIRTDEHGENALV
jgi:nitrogen regulatory protein P-II 1